MKNKNLFKISKILILSISLFFLGCEKDELTLIESKNSLIPQKMSLSNLKNDRDFKKVFDKFKLNTLTEGKNLSKNSSSLDVDFDNFYKMENEEYVSYTFSIKRNSVNNDTIIENLVVEKINDTIRGFVVSYKDIYYQKTDNENLKLRYKSKRTPFLDDINQLLNENNFNYQSKSTVKCFDTAVLVPRYCGKHKYFNFGNSACNNEKKSNWVVEMDYQCFAFDTNEIIESSGVEDNNNYGGGFNGSYSSITVPILNCKESTNGFVNSVEEGCFKVNENPGLSSDQLNNIVVQLWLTEQEKQWLETNNDAAIQIFNFLEDNKYSFQNQYTEEAKAFIMKMIEILRFETVLDQNALSFTFKAFNQDKIYNPLDSMFLDSVEDFMDIDFANVNTGYLQIQIYFTTKCAVLRYNNPTWSDAKIYWEASKDIVHIALDGFGMIPVVGEIADLTNGVLYLIEGDGVNATLSFAATIPIVGWGATSGKYLFKITASTLGTKVRLTWKVLLDGSIYFGSTGSKLRKVLGITDSALHAHHLIPWAQKIHPAVQKAAKSGNAFHINEALNGIPRPSSLHLTGHSVYNTKTQQILNSLDPNASIDEAYNFVLGFANHIRTLITNNPTLNSGQIANLISYP